MLIAQAPGVNEDREDRMFIGPSGKVLDKLLLNAQISRKEIYMTNLVKCMLPKYRRPKQIEIKLCGRYLHEEIKIINPEIIVPLGYYSTKYILQKYAGLVMSKQELRKVYGRLFLSGAWKIFPLYHPAAVLHNSSYMDGILKKYAELKTLMNYCKYFEDCSIKKYYEEGRISRKWTELYCKGNWKNCIRYKIIENRESPHVCMLPDGSIEKKLLH